MEYRKLDYSGWSKGVLSTVVLIKVKLEYSDMNYRKLKYSGWSTVSKITVMWSTMVCIKLCI